jgi:cyclic beta-1,2-glucan synthetase
VLPKLDFAKGIPADCRTLVAVPVRIAPCLPKSWGGYEAELAGREGSLVIRVRDPDRLGSGAVELVVDGVREETGEAPRAAGGTPLVEATLRAAP